MKFFHLNRRRRGSDYQYTWINGSARAKFGFPGVTCSVCDCTAGDIDVILPVSLPERLRQDPRFEDRWPIPEEEFEAMRAEAEAALRAEHTETPVLAPGANFLPLTWRVPSRPEDDVFWASFKGPIVSDRLAQDLRELGATGFELFPVEDVRCGTGSPSQPSPIPETGEPEDLDAWATAPLEDGKAFHLLGVTASSHLSPGMEAEAPCTGCGKVDYALKENWRAWDDSLWTGTDFFRFSDSRWIIVTERVADLLAERQIDNLTLNPLTPGKAVVPEPRPGWDARREESKKESKRRAALVGRIVNPEALGDNEDLRRMAEDLAKRKQTVTVLPSGPDQLPQPDLELREGDDLTGYVILLRLYPEEEPQQSGLLARITGSAAAEARFNRMARIVHESIRRFDKINPDPSVANILVLVDHDSGLEFDDLRSVNSAEDGASYRQAKRDFDHKTKGEKSKLDLCLWADAAGEETTHLLSVQRGHFAYLAQFVSLGEKESQKSKRLKKLKRR